MVTLSVIKADIGGFVGHSSVHPDLKAAAIEQLTFARANGLLIDFHVTQAGDDLQLIMTHSRAWMTRRSIVWPGTPSWPAPRSRSG
jgi:fructose 1,6-bisphosphate aldolase/phosphatase